jgi:hypothetical protein
MGAAITAANNAEYKFYPAPPGKISCPPPPMFTVSLEFAEEYNHTMPPVDHLHVQVPAPEPTQLEVSTIKRNKVLKEFQRRHYRRTYLHARPGLVGLPRFEAYCMAKGRRAAALLSRKTIDKLWVEYDLDMEESDSSVSSSRVRAARTLYQVGTPNPEEYHPF